MEVDDQGTKTPQSIEPSQQAEPAPNQAALDLLIDANNFSKYDMLAYYLHNENVSAVGLIFAEIDMERGDWVGTQEQHQ